MSTASPEIKQPHFMATAVFCEDVREEPTGATTLLAVFPDSIALPQLPAMLRKLAIQVRTVMPRGTHLKSHRVEVHMPGAQGPIARAEIDKESVERMAKADPAGGPIVTVVSLIQAQNVPMTKAGVATVEVIVDDHRVVAAILNIKVQPKA